MKRTPSPARILLALAPLFLAAAAASPRLAAALPENFDQSLRTIRAIGPEGQGNPEAAKAWNQLAAGGTDAIVPLLSAMADASPLAANWLRSAVEVISDRALKANEPLPLAGLGEFLLDVRQDAQARRFAFDLLARVEPETAEKLIPGLLHDPCPSLRRDAVARLIGEAQAVAKAGQPDAAALLYRQALNAARDSDQIKTIATSLEEAGQEVDLPRHFGFLMHWKVIGPFDNTQRAGFETVFSPEKEIDLSAQYDGKDGKVKWTDLISSDPYGMVDVNQAYGMLKEVTAYTCTEFQSETAKNVELRLGCKNAWKIWLNGELLFGRDEYHRGMRIDQYTLPATLKPGKNTVLVKLCQDHQTENWTVEWQFQLRVCDETGTAILSTDRRPTPKAEEKTRRELRDGN